MLKNKTYFIAMIFCMLWGCQQQQLEQYVRQVKKKPLKEITPFPEIKLEPALIFKHHARDPFVCSEPLEQKSDKRRKEPLEDFALNSLQLVGIVIKNEQKWALIADANGQVHRLTQGNYLGQQEGRIDKIDSQQVVISEMIFEGEWHLRKIVWALKDKV